MTKTRYLKLAEQHVPGISTIPELKIAEAVKIVAIELFQQLVINGELAWATRNALHTLQMTGDTGIEE